MTEAGPDKPAVLIVGGLGYIGRFLALHIHRGNLASVVRLVDKQLPELARLAPEFKEACARDKFMQADASREGKHGTAPELNVIANILGEESLARIYTLSNGKTFDYVFNCGGETRFSQVDEVYKIRSHALSLALGREAAKRSVKAFIELSTGMVYKPDQSPRRETDKLKPWLKLAKWKLQSEEELAKIPGLNLCILRLANVYGPYASQSTGTVLCLARVYKHLDKEMKWLWDKDLRANTVHVEDVVRACWTAARWRERKGRTEGAPPVFNIVDHGDTSQGTMAALMHDIFDIPTGFHGTLISSFARLNLDRVVDDVNDETLDPWAELQQDAGITQTTPLSPFMEKELLKENHLSMDGSKFVRETGFAYRRERISKEGVEEVIESYRRMGWWP